MKQIEKIQLPPRIKDIRGMQSGLLTAVEFEGTQGPRAYWRCICACGQEKLIAGSNITLKLTRSCGCLGMLVSSSHAGIRMTRDQIKAMLKDYEDGLLESPKYSRSQKDEVDEALEYRTWMETPEERRKELLREKEEQRRERRSGIFRPFDWTVDMCPSRYDDKNFF